MNDGGMNAKSLGSSAANISTITDIAKGLIGASGDALHRLRKIADALHGAAPTPPLSILAGLSGGVSAAPTEPPLKHRLDMIGDNVTELLREISRIEQNL